MARCIGLIVSLCVVLSVCASRVHAKPRSLKIQMPQSLDTTEFDLLTVGLGPEIPMRFGHSMIRVRDQAGHTDTTYNWGVYTYENPGFAFKFFYEPQLYWMDATRYDATVQFYKTVERRAVWQDRLVLTRKQKETLMRRIIWQSKPDNIRYPYKYFLDNCSTKVRDYLDEALGGRLREAFGKKGRGKTFRSFMRDGFRSIPAVDLLLDVTMNSQIDKPISFWDEMFLPRQLRDYLSESPAYGDDLKPQPNTMLLADGRKIVDLPPPPDSALNGHEFFLLLAGAPLIWGLVFLALWILKERKANASQFVWMEAMGIRLIALSLIVWGLFAALIGTVDVLTWIFSKHTDLHHNANLWLFWPFDFIWIGLGFGMFKRGHSCVVRSGIRKQLWFWFAFAHTAALLFFIAFWWGGAFTQDVGLIMRYLAPLATGLFALSTISIRKDWV